MYSARGGTAYPSFNLVLYEGGHLIRIYLCIHGAREPHDTVASSVFESKSEINVKFELNF